MPQMTPSQARAVDPILTEVALGYRSDQSPVADMLFPRVPVGQRGGKIIEFNAESYRLYDTRQAPGADIHSVQFGYATRDFALVDRKLNGKVPIQMLEEAAAVPGLDLAQHAIQGVADLMAREREQLAAQLALNAAAYAAENKITLTGTDQWSNPTASDPFAIVANAREAVRKKTGRRPNRMIIGPEVRTALAKHDKVLTRLRGGRGADGRDQTPATLEQLSALFELQVIEGDMQYHTGTAFVDIWGKFALLAYTETRSAQQMGTPSFGYTYQLTGRPVVLEPYWHDSQESWLYPMRDAFQPYLVGPDSGYLITGAVA